MSNTKMPNPDDLRKEVSEFLKQKYGDSVVVPQEPDLGSDEPKGEDGKPDIPSSINFDLKPSEMIAFLKKYVVGQDDALEVLATKVCTHFNRMKLETSQTKLEELMGNIKSNVLMLGPTGVGKTYIIKLIAKKIGVPFIKGDATKFSETGYVGGDVEDLVRGLVHEADGNIKLAEYGIIYLDEIDKIASSGSSYGPDVSRSGVQRNLLKLMEESEVDMKTPHDLAAQMEAAMEAQRTGKVKRKKINTKNILFVMSGAFNGMSDIIGRRMKEQPVGFRTSLDEQNTSKKQEIELLKNVKTEDLISYGFESEFVGRLPIVTVLDDLNVDGLFNILKSPTSTVVLGKKRDFQAYGIELEFTDDALKYIAEKAFDEKTGARGLQSVADRLLIRFEKTLPDTEIKSLKISKSVLLNPDAELDKLTVNSSMKKFQKEFLAKNGIVISFTDKAVNLIRQRSRESGKSFDQICRDMLSDYEYGLRLLECDQFLVDDEIVKDPKKRLEELIKNAYHKK